MKKFLAAIGIKSKTRGSPESGPEAGLPATGGRARPSIGHPTAPFNCSYQSEEIDTTGVYPGGSFPIGSAPGEETLPGWGWRRTSPRGTHRGPAYRNPRCVPVVPEDEDEDGDTLRGRMMQVTMTKEQRQRLQPAPAADRDLLPRTRSVPPVGAPHLDRAQLGRRPVRHSRLPVSPGSTCSTLSRQGEGASGTLRLDVYHKQVRYHPDTPLPSRASPGGPYSAHSVIEGAARMLGHTSPEGAAYDEAGVQTSLPYDSLSRPETISRLSSHIEDESPDEEPPYLPPRGTPPTTLGQRRKPQPAPSLLISHNTNYTSQSSASPQTSPVSPSLTQPRLTEHPPSAPTSPISDRTEQPLLTEQIPSSHAIPTSPSHSTASPSPPTSPPTSPLASRTSQSPSHDTYDTLSSSSTTSERCPSTASISDLDVPIGTQPRSPSISRDEGVELVTLEDLNNLQRQFDDLRRENERLRHEQTKVVVPISETSYQEINEHATDVSECGKLLWRVTHFEKKLGLAKDEAKHFFYSAPFLTGPMGYRLCARVYMKTGPYADTHLGVDMLLLPGRYDHLLLGTPFSQPVTLKLIDHGPSKAHFIRRLDPTAPEHSPAKRPWDDTRLPVQCPDFYPLEKLHTGDRVFIKDDGLFIYIDVEPFNVADNFL